MTTDGRTLILGDDELEVDCLYMDMFSDHAQYIDKLWKLYKNTTDVKES